MSGPRDVRLPAEQQDLKAASKALVRAYGGQEAASELLGRAQSRYSDTGSPNTEVFLTICEVAALEDRTAGAAGHPIVTRELARRQGYELVARPRALPAAEDLIACVGDLMREGADVMSAIGDALKDKRWTREEVAAALKQIDELVLVAVTLRAAVASARTEAL